LIPLQEVSAKSTPQRRSSANTLDFIQVPQDKIEHPYFSTGWREGPRNTVAPGVLTRRSEWQEVLNC
jgi:hypothetical protein